MKTRIHTILLLFLANLLTAQENAIDIVAGAIYPIRTSEKLYQEKPKTGLTFGLMFRRKNLKGDIWSVNAEYQLLQNKGKLLVNNKEESFTERLEMLYLRGSPLLWFLDKKQRGFVDIGVFGTYLLHEEVENMGNLVSNTKVLRRYSLGPSICVGLQLGDTLRKSFVVGLRDDYSVVSFGKKQGGDKGIPLKFNTISLFVGLGI